MSKKVKESEPIRGPPVADAPVLECRPMLKCLGIEGRAELLLFLAVLALVAITPLGREGTSGIVLISHRLLLLAIMLGSIYTLKSKLEPEICPIFVGWCVVVALLMLVSVVWNPGSTFDGMYRWYQYVLFGGAFLTMALANRERNTQWKRALLWAIIGVDIMYVVVALLARHRPLIGPFVNPNYFASFLLVGYCAALAFAFFETDRSHRLMAGGFSIFLYYGMTQTWSRGATVAAIAAAMLGLYRFSRQRKFSKKAIGIVLLLAVIAGAVVSPSLLQKFLDRGQTDPYNYQRPSLWLAALHVIAEHPMFGVGPGEFYYVSKRFSPAVEGTLARYMKRPGIAHSEYLQLAAESGIPAALLMFALAGYLVYIALNRARKCPADRIVFQEAAILTATALGLHALVDNNWSVPIMAAGLVVFSLGDVLPIGEWRFPFEWTTRTRLIFAITMVFVVFQAVLIPGIAVYCNDAGQAAYNHHDLTRAESMLRLASAIAPNSAVFLDNAGVVYSDKFMESHDSRWLDVAEMFFSQAMTANPNADQPGHHLENVLVQRLTGNPGIDRPIHTGIVEVERRILVIDPVNPFVRRNLAEALYNTGDRDGAERELNRAIEYEPNYVAGYLRMSDWYREAGNLATSAEYRDRGLAIAMKHRNDRTVEPYESLLLGRPINPQTGASVANHEN